MKKKIIAGVLAASMCLTMAACDKPDFEDSTVIDPNLTTTVAPTPTSTTVGDITTTEIVPPAQTTTTQTPEQPIPVETAEDLESVLVGKYVTLVYNAASADVTWEVEKGVGTRENVTFTVTPFTVDHSGKEVTGQGWTVVYNNGEFASATRN
jgi:hypothetical protein